MTAFHDGAEPQARRALERIGRVWQSGRPPDAGSPAARLPQGTIDQLLTRLGYLTEGSAAGRGAAIRAFEADRGLTVTGAPSLALMNQLLIAAMIEIFADGVNSIAISNGVARLELVQLRRNTVGEAKLVPEPVGTLFLPVAGLQQMLQQLNETAHRVQEQQAEQDKGAESQARAEDDENAAEEALTNL
jgi:hypothetical protein